MVNAYILSLNPLDWANEKWDFGLLQETFDKKKINIIKVDSLPEEDRAFVVVSGGGNSGKEDEICPQDCIDDWVIINWAWESKD